MYYLTKFCCFCLKHQESFLNINSSNFQNVNILHKLMFCVKYDLDTSEIPTFICQNCCTKLDEAYEFKKTSLKNWNLFQNYIRKLKHVHSNCKTKPELNEIKIMAPKIKFKEVELEFNIESNLNECSENEENEFSVNEELLEKVESENNRASEGTIDDVTEKKQLLDENGEFTQVDKGQTGTIEIKSEFDNFDTISMKEEIIEDCDLNDLISENCQLYSCSTCGNTFKTQSELNDHTSITHPDTSKLPVYKCFECGTSYHRKWILIEHMIKNHINKNQRKTKQNVIKPKPIKFAYKPIQCSLCSRCFASQIHLNQHLRMHENKQPLICTICNKTFWKQALLNSHIRSHNNKKQTYTCTNCSRTFCNKRNLTVHVQRQHGDQPIPDHSFSCYACKERFSTELDLKEHVLIHSDEKPFMCRQCGRGFTVKWNYKLHLYTHNDKDRPYFNCSICGTRYTTKFALNVHLKMHNNKRRYACALCNITFCERYILDRHKLIHHSSSINELKEGSKSLSSCEFLNAQEQESKESNQELSLKSTPATMELPQDANDNNTGISEEETHNCLDPNDPQNSLLKCSKCGKLFTTKKGLQLHLLEERPFACSNCEKRFKVKSELTKHMQIHTDTRLFNCPLCDKKFKTKHCLSQHQRNHSDNRPYSCTVCRKSFKAKKTLDRHTIALHSNL